MVGAWQGLTLSMPIKGSLGRMCACHTRHGQWVLLQVLASAARPSCCSSGHYPLEAPPGSGEDHGAITQTPTAMHTPGPCVKRGNIGGGGSGTLIRCHWVTGQLAIRADHGLFPTPFPFPPLDEMCISKRLNICMWPTQPPITLQMNDNKSFAICADHWTGLTTSADLYALLYLSCINDALLKKHSSFSQHMF